MLPIHARNFEHAKALLAYGWVVLPMNPKTKTPLVAWSKYVSGAIPSEADLAAWAKRGMFEGIGILTGSTSRNLLVIDFDDLGQAQKFIEAFPSLSKTMQIQTRRGIHFYYIADGFTPHKTSFTGGDILWNAPVMSIPSSGYRRLNQLPILKISEEGYNAFLSIFKPITEDFPTKHNPQSRFTLQQIESLYNQNKGISRNQAIFHALCLARDNQFTQSQVLSDSMLLDLFVKTKSSVSHAPESERQRVREFMRTLHSVYKRAPRPLREKEIVRLSDDSRSRLCKAGLTGVSRVLDALYQAGISDGIISRKEIHEAVGDIIARDVIDMALNAEIHGKRIFTVLKSSPSPAPHPFAIAEKSINKNASYGRKKTGKYFLMPSPEKIQRLTGALYRASTVIERQDIDSVRSYRAILLKAKVLEPRKIYQVVLATDLGVTKRSVRNYFAFIGYKGLPQTKFISTVTFSNLKHIFEVEYSKAYFLIAHNGTKAPATLGGALWLLRKQKTAIKSIMLMKQTASIYVPIAIQERTESKAFKQDLEDLFNRYEKGTRGDSLNAIAESLPNRLNPKHPHFDANLAAIVATREIASKEYFEQLNSHNAQLKAESEQRQLEAESYLAWHEMKLKAAMLRNVREQAVTLCQLLPKKLLSHQNAAKLILMFGEMTCYQAAMKITQDYHAAKMKNRPIKNPIGLMIKRLKEKGITMPISKNVERIPEGMSQ